MVHRPRALAAFALPLGVVVACSAGRYNSERGPAVTFPAHFLERHSDDAGAATTHSPAKPAPDSGRRALLAKPVGSQPDPEPLRLARQWQYTLLYDHGKVSVQHVRALRFAHPVVTARNMGRYAIELWIGRELVDRVRFDFPLVAAEVPEHGPRHPLHEPPTFAAGAVVTRRVLVPASSRATRAVLVDRATGARQALPWPPDHPLSPPGVPERASQVDGGAAEGGSASGGDAGPR